MPINDQGCGRSAGAEYVDAEAGTGVETVLANDEGSSNSAVSYREIRLARLAGTLENNKVLPRLRALRCHANNVATAEESTVINAAKSNCVSPCSITRKPAASSASAL